MSLLLHPTGARVIPFIAFVALTFAQGHVSGPGPYWIYLAKTLVGAALLWFARPALAELRWNFSWEAVVVGIGVFVLWVGLDPLLVQLGFPNSYPKMNLGGTAWNPNATFGPGSWEAVLFIGTRIAGSALLVPMLEELFFRSFLYRYVERPDFLTLPLGHFSLRAFMITAAVFGVEHREWLAGALTAFAYQGLVCRKNRLGDAITAHAITNLLLGVWVVWKGAWHFW